MLKDARMQILYFNQTADVLLEFGLQGNYSLRLLTVQCNNYKDFLANLSKAVSRNNIILTVGGFGPQDRLPEILGRGIGRELTAVVAEEFRITAPVHTRLPEGAIPLVTDEGILAGCVIEQGTQTIIMLTEQTELRHQVLKKLVIPYIGERLRFIGGAPAAPTPPEAPPAETPTPQPTGQTDTPLRQEETQDIYSNSVPCAPQERPEPPVENTPAPIGRRTRIAATVVCILLAVALALGACGLAYYVLQKSQHSPAGQKIFLYENTCPFSAENERIIW